VDAKTPMAELVRRARTIRRFDEGDPIAPSTLRELVDLARLTPSAANKQQLRFRIVAEPTEREAVFGCLTWAASLPEWPGPARGERPTGYIVLCGPGAVDVNSGIAAQTIQLAACERGYGCCMMAAIDRRAIQRLLAIPDRLQIQLVLALGRAAESVTIDEVSDGADLRYYRTPDQVHHVPKLRLQDVLL